MGIASAGWPFNGCALPYDPEQPPVFSPGPHTDRLLWQVARHLFADHRPDENGCCVLCEQCYPCVPRRLADVGLRAASRRTGRGWWRTWDTTPVDRRDRYRWLLRAPTIYPAPTPMPEPESETETGAGGSGPGDWG